MSSKFVAFGAACLLVTTALGASADSFDGTWKGTLSCDKLSFTRGAQKVPITLTVSGMSATFSRQVFNRENTAVVGTEEGTGTVSASGAVDLSSTWKEAGANPRFTFTAAYAGTLQKGGASLQGTQIWSVDGNKENRGCSITLKR